MEGRLTTTAWASTGCHETTREWEHILSGTESHGAAHSAWQVYGEQLSYSETVVDGEGLDALWGDDTRRRAGAQAMYQALEHERGAIVQLGNVISSRRRE